MGETIVSEVEEGTTAEITFVEECAASEQTAVVETVGEAMSGAEVGATSAEQGWQKKSTTFKPPKAGRLKAIR